MGGSIGSRMEICENLGLPIPMKPRLHQSNGYIKKKLRLWKAQKCIALVGAEVVLTGAGTQTTPFHGGWYGVGNGNMRKLGPTNPPGTAFAPNIGYIKRKLREWRAQKYVALVGVEIVLTSAGQQTTLFHGWQDRFDNGNMRNFGPTNPHGTTFPPKQWLYQKEATGMESS